MQQEQTLHKAVCTYLKLQYPTVLFNTDLSGVRLSRGVAGQVKGLRSSNGFPDIVIYEPRWGKFGLFLELKVETPFTRKGVLKSDPHLHEQWEMIEKLNQKGYCASFVVGFDSARQLIDNYLGKVEGKMR